MRRIILTLTILILISFTTEVHADACSDLQIIEGQTTVENLTFNLEYDNDHLDMNGDKVDGFFKLTFPNLPTGYNVEVITKRGEYFSYSPSDVIYSNGGVLQIIVRSNECEGILKSFEIKVPFYKQYCNLDKECDKNIWFDGTYENNPANYDKPQEDKVNVKLIIILVVLIAIIIGCIVFAIRKRRLDAQDL